MKIIIEQWQDIGRICGKYADNEAKQIPAARTRADSAYHRGKYDAYQDIAEMINRGEIVIEAKKEGQ